MQAFHSFRQPPDFLDSAFTACSKLQSSQAVLQQCAKCTPQFGPSLAHSVSVIQGAHGRKTKKMQCAESVALAGEFEPHANAWMGWPDSGMLWREDAKPAQKQYADVAKAISQFEPVVMMANPEVRTLLHTQKNNCACVVHWRLAEWHIVPLSSSPRICAM